MRIRETIYGKYECGILMNKSIHLVLNLPATFRGAWKSSCAVERGPSLVTPSNKPPISSAGLAGAVGGGKKMSISSEDSLSDFEELGGRSFKRFFMLIASVGNENPLTA